MAKGSKEQFEEEVEKLEGKERGPQRIALELPDEVSVTCADVAERTGLSVRLIRDLVRTEALRLVGEMKPVRVLVTEYLAVALATDDRVEP